MGRGAVGGDRGGSAAVMGEGAVFVGWNCAICAWRERKRERAFPSLRKGRFQPRRMQKISTIETGKKNLILVFIVCVGLLSGLLSSFIGTHLSRPGDKRLDRLGITTLLSELFSAHGL